IAAPVTGEKGDALPFQCANDNGIRRIPKRRLDADLAGVEQTAHGVEAAAADHTDFCGGGIRPHTLAPGLFPASHSCFSKWIYRFKSTGSISIFPSRSYNLAAATSGS